MAFPPRFVHARFVQFVAISLRRQPGRTALGASLGSWTGGRAAEACEGKRIRLCRDLSGIRVTKPPHC